MKKATAPRREFLKNTTIAFGMATNFSAIQNLEAGIRADSSKLTIACVGAHPGDPEFGCGGTMARYSTAGHHVVFVYLTRGEAFDPAKSASESATLRTREAEKSCGVLGATPIFAGQVDGATILRRSKEDEMAKLLESIRPDIVFTHWPIDSHPDHQVAGLLTMTAWIKSGKKFELYFYEVNTGSETMAFTPSEWVDITSVREKKKSAMFAHQTQSPEKLYDTLFKTMEGFRGFEAGVEAAEGFVHFRPKTIVASIQGT